MNRFPLAAALAVLLSAAAGTPVAAQEPPPETPRLEAGVRVRVSDPSLGHRPREGLVAGVAGDSLAVYFARGRAADTLLLSGVRRVEVSRGYRPPDYPAGLMVGASAGLFVGLAVSAAVAAAIDAGGEGFPLVGVLLVPPSVGIGAVAGLLSARPRERWEPVRLDAAEPAPF
jgi:hypothetical protein